MQLGHNLSHLFYFAIVYALGLTTGLVIAFSRVIKDKARENKESLERLQEVINTWKKRDYDNR